MRGAIAAITLILGCGCGAHRAEYTLRVEGGAGTTVVADYFERSSAVLGPGQRDERVAAEVVVTDAGGRAHLHRPASASHVYYVIARPGFRTWWGPEHLNKAGPTRTGPDGLRLLPSRSFYEESEAVWELSHRVDDLCAFLPEPQAKLLRARRDERVAQLKSRYSFAYDRDAALRPRRVGELFVRVGSWAAWRGHGGGRTSSGIETILLRPGGGVLLGDVDRKLHLWTFDAQGAALAQRTTGDVRSRRIGRVHAARARDGGIVVYDERSLRTFDEALQETGRVALQPAPTATDRAISLQILRDGRALVGFTRERAPGVARVYGIEGRLQSERAVGELEDLRQVGMLDNGTLVVAGEARSAGKCTREIGGVLYTHRACTSRVLLLPQRLSEPRGEVSGMDAFAVRGDHVVALLPHLVPKVRSPGPRGAEAAVDRLDEERAALLTIGPTGRVVQEKLLETRAIGPLAARALDVLGDRVGIVNRESAACDVVEIRL